MSLRYALVAFLFIGNLWASGGTTPDEQPEHCEKLPPTGVINWDLALNLQDLAAGRTFEQATVPGHTPRVDPVFTAELEHLRLSRILEGDEEEVSPLDREVARLRADEWLMKCLMEGYDATGLLPEPEAAKIAVQQVLAEEAAGLFPRVGASPAPEVDNDKQE